MTSQGQRNAFNHLQGLEHSVPDREPVVKCRNPRVVKFDETGPLT
jgi:hypothetical protein